jgi:hypothetical protein
MWWAVLVRFDLGKKDAYWASGCVEFGISLLDVFLDW